MFKYAKIINEETKQVAVGTGIKTKFYESIGMVQMEVERAFDGSWYVAGYAPQPPEKTKEEIAEQRRQLYISLVDPLTSQIQRLRDEEQTEGIISQIESLKNERSELVKKIKEENPYPISPEVETNENLSLENG